MKAVTFKKQSLLMATLFVCISATAQDDNINLQEKYKNFNAVMTDNSEHLVIKYDSKAGEFDARSNVREERLMISDMSPGMYNTQTIYHSYFSKLDEVSGVTLVPDKKGFRTIKAKDYATKNSEHESVFYDDTKETEVSFSGLVPDARTRIDYTIYHRDLHFLPTFYFQEYTPVVKSTFKITAPKFMKIKFVLVGEYAAKVKQTTEEDGSNMIYTWTAEDLPAIKSYTDAPNVSYYALHIMPYIDNYQGPDDEKQKHILGNPDDLYHYYYKFIKNVNKEESEIISNTVAEITKGDVTQRQKAEHIYHWVQQNMHYVAFEDKLNGFIPRDAKDICKNKFGDCKDMTSIQVAMYRKAGIPAYFTWIGTRDKPYTYEQVPLPVADNHMICTIHIDDQWIFLDGTHPFIPFGIPPSAIQGKEALVGIDATTYKIIKVPERAATENTSTDSSFIQINGTDLDGTANIKYTGYPAWYIGTIMTYRNETEKDEAIRSLTSRGSNKFIQNDYTYNIANNFNKDASITSKFQIKGYVQNLGKEYYVNMNLLRSYEGEHVDDMNRKASIEHTYKIRSKQVVVLDIPKGYKVSYLPPNDQMSVNGLLSYKISYTKTAKQVILTKEYELQTLYVTAAQFAEQNKLVEGLKKQYKESVVFTAN